MLFKMGETLFSSNGGDGSSDKDTACSDDSFSLNIDSDADLEKPVYGNMLIKYYLSKNIRCKKIMSSC